jgi:protein-tyrosine phosphatase
VIDLHCHVLPGIDDGPTTIEGSLAIARLAAAGGTRVLVATPHVNWRYRNDAATIAQRVGELNERLAAEEILTADGYPLEVQPGAEIALTLVADLQDAQLDALGLGGGPWLLVEPPFTPVAPNLEALLLELQANRRSAGGHRVVLAHPERCPVFQRDPAMLERLVRAGMITSITAGSLGGQFGGEARRLALALARGGLLHNVASDAHDTVNRPPEIAAELKRAGLAPLARWLTVTVPTAILAGEGIPPAPASDVEQIEVERSVERARRGWWRSLRR